MSVHFYMDTGSYLLAKIASAWDTTCSVVVTAPIHVSLSSAASQGIVQSVCDIRLEVHTMSTENLVANIYRTFLRRLHIPPQIAFSCHQPRRR